MEQYALVDILVHRVLPMTMCPSGRSAPESSKMVIVGYHRMKYLFSSSEADTMVGSSVL